MANDAETNADKPASEDAADKAPAKAADAPAEAKPEAKPAAKPEVKVEAKAKPAAKADAKADAKPAAKTPAAKKPVAKKPKAPAGPRPGDERWHYDPIRGLRSHEENGELQTRIAQLEHLKYVYAELSDDEEAKGFVKNIDLALDRVRNGMYFVCATCGKDMPRDNIKRQNYPWVTSCTGCLTKA